MYGRDTKGQGVQGDPRPPHGEPKGRFLDVYFHLQNIPRSTVRRHLVRSVWSDVKKMTLAVRRWWIAARDGSDMRWRKSREGGSRRGMCPERDIGHWPNLNGC